MQQFWVLVFVTAITTVVNCHVQDLRVDVLPMQSRFAAVQDVRVILRYVNNGGETMGIYKWYLPENDLFDPIFQVTRDGEPVEYVGPLVKRQAPTVDDVVYLTSGMAVTAVVDLSSVYDMTQTGNYVIQYKMNADQVLMSMGNMHQDKMMSSNDDQDFVLQSAPIEVFTAGRRNLLIEEALEARTQPKALTPTFYSCTSSESSSIRSALNAGENYANEAVQYMNSISWGTTRYTTWFGQYSSSNGRTLTSRLTNIRDTLKSKALSFDCSCPGAGSGTFAYVYANRPYKIYLCGAFWRAPTVGTDSRGGTIVHEAAHFSVVVGTSDYAYGHSKAKSLARSNPSRALMNSDNYEYFVENNPSLS